MSSQQMTPAWLVEFITENWGIPVSFLFDASILPSSDPEEQWPIDLLDALSDLSIITMINEDSSGHAKFTRAREMLTELCEEREERAGYAGNSKTMRVEDVRAVIERMGGMATADSNGQTPQQVASRARMSVAAGPTVTPTTARPRNVRIQTPGLVNNLEMPTSLPDSPNGSVHVPAGSHASASFRLLSSGSEHRRLPLSPIDFEEPSLAKPTYNPGGNPASPTYIVRTPTAASSQALAPTSPARSVRPTSPPRPASPVHPISPARHVAVPHPPRRNVARDHAYRDLRLERHTLLVRQIWQEYDIELAPVKRKIWAIEYEREDERWTEEEEARKRQRSE
jgi:hypothetical protein